MVKNFNTTYTRFQTGTFLFVGAQVVDGTLLLNKVSTVTEADIPATNVRQLFMEVIQLRYPLTRV